MPQLEPSSFISQIFWLTITFLSLWFVMSYFIVPRIASIIDERRQKIDTDIQKAEKVNQNALNILSRYEAMIEKAKETINQELSEKNLELQRLDGFRTNLVSATSHEFRTPLTSIKGYTSSLLRHDIQLDDETRKKSLKIIHPIFFAAEITDIS